MNDNRHGTFWILVVFTVLLISIYVIPIEVSYHNNPDETLEKLSELGSIVEQVGRELNILPTPSNTPLPTPVPPKWSLLSNSTGKELWHNVSWSPDNTKLVFESNNTIYVVNNDGGDLVNILDGASNPAWNPSDYSHIACNDLDGAFYIMDIDNDMSYRIGDYGLYPTWSPDGKTLATVKMASRGYGIELTDVSDIHNPQEIDTYVAKSIPFGMITSLDWWGDNLLMSMISNVDGQPYLYVLNLKTLMVTSLGVKGCNPRWAPNGNQIVYNWLPQFNLGMSVVSCDGADHVIYIKDAWQDTAPEWIQSAFGWDPVYSHDGNWIVYFEKQLDVHYLMALNVNLYGESIDIDLLKPPR